MNKSKLTFLQNPINKQWRRQIKSNNGETIGASTEYYHNRKDCIHNALLVYEDIKKYIQENS